MTNNSDCGTRLVSSQNIAYNDQPVAAYDIDGFENSAAEVATLQGQGYATEAAAACRDFARDVLGARRLTAIIHPDNRPSQRVAEKIGLTPEKRTRDRTGKDVVLYAAEW